MLMIDLRGKVALVTGGSRGIGRGITLCLCRAGAYTVFTHTGNPEQAKSVAALREQIQEEGLSAEDCPVDALSPEGAEKVVEETLRGKGKIDVLVCNVGQNLERAVEETTIKSWAHFVDTNLSSAFYAVKAVIPHMVERGFGRIVLIGSSAAYDGGGGAIDYAAAKAGLSGMMRYLCKSYTRKGINTNVVHPCVIGTDLVRQRYSTEEAWQKLVSQVPVGRVGTPEDIGAMVAYLASPWGDYITGQEILLDGGRTLWRF
jgi:3-oxoacyl-[acyl-carrier protein] reductase